MSGPNANSNPIEDDFTSRVRRVSDRLRGDSAPPPDTAAQAKKSKKKGEKNAPTFPTNDTVTSNRTAWFNQSPTGGGTPNTARNMLEVPGNGVMSTNPTGSTPTTIRILASALANRGTPTESGQQPAAGSRSPGAITGRVPIIVIHTPTERTSAPRNAGHLIDPSLLGVVEVTNPRTQDTFPSNLNEQDVVNTHQQCKRLHRLDILPSVMPLCKATKE